MAKGPKIPSGSTVEIPLSQIDVDPSWNCRSEAFWVDGAFVDAGGGGYKGFKEGVARRGLRRAVIVRPMMVRGETRYMLVTGFIRHHAVRELYEEGRAIPGLTPGHLRCEVVAMDDREARIQNILDNLDEPVSVQDQAWGGYELYKMRETVTDIASLYNKGEDEIEAWVTIFEKLPPKYWKAWRAGESLDRKVTGVSISVGNMVKLAESCAPDLRDEQYAKYLRAAQLKPPRKGARGRDARLKRDKGRAKKLGRSFGRALVRAQAAGFIKVMMPDNSAGWLEMFRTMVHQERAGWSADELTAIAAVGMSACLETIEKGDDKAEAPPSQRGRKRSGE